jgi:nucleotide-binding universal stress UspA family protein
MPYRHILLPLDFSEEARRTLPVALDLAAGSGAKVTLLHVVPDVQLTPHGAPFAPPLDGTTTAAEVEAARKHLEQHRGMLAGVREVAAQVLTSNDPARTITEMANTEGCDLILISTHGRTGFRRFMLGSVAEAVVRRAEVPVLCIPRHK